MRPERPPSVTINNSKLHKKTNATSVEMTILAATRSLVPLRSQLQLQGVADGGQKQGGKKRQMIK